MLRKRGATSRRQFLSLSAVLLASCGGGGSRDQAAPPVQETATTTARDTPTLLHKDGVWDATGCETAMVTFNGEPLAITFVRDWSSGSFEAYGIRVTRYLTGEILAEHPWTGGMGCAIVRKGVIHIFGNTNWQSPGNKIIHSTLAADFSPSAPADALLMNAPDKPFKFYNTSVTADANGYRMVAETTAGVYFARSTDLSAWTFDGGELMAGQYCGCPSINYISGVHWLTFLAHLGDGVYETRVAHSTDDCFTFTYGQALLTPDSFDGKNCSDVDMVEVGGRVYGVFMDGDQVTWGRLRRWHYDGTLAQLFTAYQ